jgi:AMMECR1 domain-containing protein
MKPRRVTDALLAAILCITVMASSEALHSREDQALERWSEFSKKAECRKLMAWLRCMMRTRLTGTKGCGYPDIETPPFFGSRGMFITLKRGIRIRGCYGAFSHAMTDVRGLLSDYLTGALTRDPRYAPLDASELADTEIILTVATMPSPVSDVGAMDMSRYGVLLVCNGEETAVFVPAEIRAASYIERFMRGKSCQVSAFRAITIR